MDGFHKTIWILYFLIIVSFSILLLFFSLLKVFVSSWDNFGKIDFPSKHPSHLDFKYIAIKITYHRFHISSIFGIIFSLSCLALYICVFFFSSLSHIPKDCLLCWLAKNQLTFWNSLFLLLYFQLFSPTFFSLVLFFF